MNTKAIIYTRVSTNEQTKGYSLPTQVKGCMDYAQRHGLDVVATIQDNISGASRLNERAGGKEMLHMIRNGHQIGAVIVWRLDRLSRPPEGEYSRLLTTIETMGRFGVAVHDCETGEIKNSMESIMIAFFKGLAASKEREAIKERSMRGRLAKAKEGKWIGQGWTPYGYRKIGMKRDSRLEIDEYEAKIIRRIFDLFTGKNGLPMSLRAIAQLLTQEGVPTPGRGGNGHGEYWNQSHISRRILRRRAYIGEFEYKEIKMYFPELAIIDNTTWEIAQELLTRNKRRPRHNTTGMIYLMTGRIECTCSGTFSGFHTQANGRTHAYYRCNRKTRYGRQACNEGNLKVGNIDKISWDWLADTIGNNRKLDEIISEMAANAAAELKPNKEELETVQELIIKAEKKTGRLMSSFGNTDDPTIAAALKNEIENTAQLKQSLEQQRASLQGKIDSAEITPVVREEIKATAQRVRQNLNEGGTMEDRQALSHALNFQATLFYRDGDKWLRLSFGLGKQLMKGNEVCIDNQSYTRPV